MKAILIYDPAMCCSTGVCGPSVDTELLRVATTVDSLKKQGANINRYNLANEPIEFIKNNTINEMLKQDENILPVTLVDGEVVKTKAHLTNEEFENYTGFKVGQNAGAQAEQPQSGGCCCSSDSDCCK